MPDIDEKKPTGKAGKRKRNADQRNRKPDQKQAPKADQPQAAKAQAHALMVAPTDMTPIETAASKVRADATIRTTDTAVAANVNKPSAVLMGPSEAAPVAEHRPAPTIPTADAGPVAAPAVSEPSAVSMASATAPVAAQDVRKPPAAPTTSPEPTMSVAPVARPKVKEPTVTSTATQMSAEAAPVPAADVSVSLQTIANAYGEYTRKSLEQTKCFFDKLKEVRSLEQAVEIQTEFAKQACETFVAEAQRIHELHRELARQRFERLEGLITMGAQAS